jgi:hypothetical protein
MGRRVLLAAALLAVLTVPASGARAATTRVVDQAAGPYTTITDALLAATPGDTIDIHEGHYDEDLWVDKDDITLRGRPGTIVTQTAPFVVSLMGARDALEDLTIAGGPGGVRIAGSGARLVRTTVLADATAVSIEGALSTTMVRSLLRATGLSGTALVARNDAPAPAAQATELAASVLVGGRLGTAMDVVTGAVGDTTPTGPATVDLVFSTVAGAPTALRSARDGQGGPVAVNAYNAIVHGGGAGGLGGLPADTTSADASTFVNAAALDFHLRADAPGIGRAWPLPDRIAVPEIDFDGVPRSRLAASWGAFEFVNHAPSAVLTAPVAAVRQGVPVRFDASGSADPDPGGRIVRYVWVFGDGSIEATTTEPTVEHVFAGVGRPLVTVRAIDQGGAGTTSAKVPIVVTDAIAPALAITSPRERSRLHRLRTVRRGPKRRRVVNVLRFGGHASDAVGVARVDVTLAQRRTKAVKRPLVLAGRATLMGGAWSWRTPAKRALPAGSYTLTVRAADAAGNVSVPGVLHFTVT